MQKYTLVQKKYSKFAKVLQSMHKNAKVQKSMSAEQFFSVHTKTRMSFAHTTDIVFGNTLFGLLMKNCNSLLSAHTIYRIPFVQMLDAAFDKFVFGKLVFGKFFSAFGVYKGFARVLVESFCLQYKCFWSAVQKSASVFRGGEGGGV
jgi:hypothetical protein